MKWTNIFSGIGNKKTGLIVICLLLSSVLWVLTKLSNTYQEDLNIEVGYSNIPSDMFLDKSFRNKVKVRVQGTGFSLLKHNFKKESIILNLNELKHLRENIYQFPKDINQLLISQDFDNLSVRNIITDTVQIDLQPRVSKRVPVVFHPNASYRIEYQLTDLIVKPDSVTVSGYKKSIDTMSGLYLSGQKMVNIDDSFEQTFRLKNDKGIRYSDSLVRIQGIVSKMSERVIRVPVMINHTPANIDLKLFPSEVDLVCSGAIGVLKKVNPSDFQVFADYSNRDEERALIPLKIMKSPQNLKTNFLSNKAVEYLIRKK